MVVSCYGDVFIVLNWRHYGDSALGVSDAPVWAVVIRYFIIYFPALDVISAFPITCAVLANNVAALYFSRSGGDGGNIKQDGTKSHKKTKKDEDDARREANDEVDLANHSLLAWVLFRGLSALPPLIGATFIASVASVLDLVGIFGIFIIFIFPPLFSLRSLSICERIWGDKGKITPFSTIFSGMPAITTALVLGVLVLCFCTLMVVVSDFLPSSNPMAAALS